jgi:glyoxylase-like metal-dependent hydrolase (beta-lactamase superfamily II)
MTVSKEHLLSRRGFCLCCIGGAATATAGGWLTPRQAFAEARGIVSLIKDSAATSPIVTHKLRGNISALEGSGGTVAVLTGPDGKVLIDAGIGVSRPQLTKALADLGTEPITHLINTHWHFDHTDGNAWLNAAGAKIIAQDNTLKYLSQVQRVATGGSIDGMIAASDANLAATAEDTIIIAGHGKAVGTRAELRQFRDMLVAIRDNVAALKKQGRSREETVAAKPTSAFDAKFGNFVIDPGFFTRLVYQGV